MADKIQTKLLHNARGEKKAIAPVNPPVMRASTIVFDTLRDWRDVRDRRGHERLLSYGARGTETAFELEKLITTLESGHRVQLFSTGLAALATVLLCFAKSGGHVLLADSVYEPVRKIVKEVLAPNNISYDYFKTDGSDFETKLKPNTQIVFAESPGSLIYELLDLPKICEIAHARNIPVAVDNTWGSGLLYNPLELGADISIIAATKYLCGHSDVMMGIASFNEKTWNQVGHIPEILGQAASPDDCYLVLRGMRTLYTRLKAHEANAIAVAQWLQTRPEVKTVFCPALPAHDRHDLYLRDCKGTNGLLTIELNALYTADDVETFIDRLQLFGIGASWGGFESLALPANVKGARTATDYQQHGQFIRFHIGLEASDDLIADLEHAFNLIKK